MTQHEDITAPVTGQIILDNIRFHACHGVAAQERTVGNDFTVTLRATYDMTRAMTSDALANAVSYADVYDVVKHEMEQPSRLIENVAWRIARALFRNFPPIRSVRVTIMKRRPPICADMESAGVDVTITRTTAATTLKNP